MYLWSEYDYIDEKMENKNLAVMLGQKWMKRNELLKIKDISLSSDTIKSMYHICQYLFSYDEELIEYYKNHMYIAHANIEKERMEKMALDGEY
jgi:hypothetical protein